MFPNTKTKSTKCSYSFLFPGLPCMSSFGPWPVCWLKGFLATWFDISLWNQGYFDICIYPLQNLHCQAWTHKEYLEVSPALLFGKWCLEIEINVTLNHLSFLFGICNVRTWLTSQTPVFDKCAFSDEHNLSHNEIEEQHNFNIENSWKG